MSITVDELQELADHGKVVTDRGEKVGPIGEIYVDDLTGVPDWVTVRTGLLGTAETFVPLAAARVDGYDVVVPYAKDVIKDAPRIDADGALSPQEERILYRHYGIGASGRETGALDVPDERTQRSGPTDDVTMIRSEERLVVGTEQRETGRARLRKHVVTERVTQTVTVRHEEARLVREPVADADRAAATSGPTFDEQTYEVVLHAESPVVEKTVVPVERVRLDTVTVTGKETVSADVRRERVELDGPTGQVDHPAVTSVSDVATPKGATDKPKGTPKGKKGTRRRR